MDGIEARLKLPTQANHHGGYLTFYVGFGDQIEAGVSYSQKWSGWNRFINNHGTPTNGGAGGIGLGSKVVLSLERGKSGHVVFTANGQPIGKGYLAQPTEVKMVMAVLYSAGSSFSETEFSLISHAGADAWRFDQRLGSSVHLKRIKALSQNVMRFAAQMP